jgi:hypothetical protein
MQRFQPLLGLLMSVIVVSGCGSAFEVHQNKVDVGGVPFYVKTAVCEHNTAYIFSYYVITYQTLSNEKVVTTESVTMSSATYNSLKEVKDFLEILRKKDNLNTNDIRSANEKWNILKDPKNNIDPYHKALGHSGRSMIANTAIAKVIVDYDHLYTLNARVPFAGSVNTSYKLNADGTLSEGSSQIEDKTFETVLNFVSETLKAATSAGIMALDGGHPYWQAKTEKRALKITYSYFEKFNEGCNVADTLPQDKKKTSFVIEEIAPKDTAQKDDAKPKDNEITVTGKITLPPKPAADSGANGGGAAGGAVTEGNKSLGAPAQAKKPATTKPPLKKPGGKTTVTQ